MEPEKSVLLSPELLGSNTLLKSSSEDQENNSDEKIHTHSLFQYHLSVTERASCDPAFSKRTSTNELGVHVDTGREEMFTYKLVGNKYTVTRIPYHGGGERSPNTNYSYAISNGLVDDIKMSRDCSHISIRRGGSIEMLSLVGGYSINYRVPSEGLLLSYFWPWPSLLLVICSTGFELLKVSTDNMKTKLVRRIEMQINWFVYSPSSRILLVSTSQKPSILQGFSFLKDFLNEPLLTMPLFDLFTKGEIPKGKSCNSSDIVISKIYNAIFCIHSDIKDRKIRLWKLSIYDVLLMYEIDVLASGKIQISVIDNLIVVHCLNEKVSMIYDIHAEPPDDNSKPGHAPVRVRYPIAAPLPVTPFTVSGDEKQITDLSRIYENWTFLYPDYIYSRNECKIWKLTIHLQQIIKDVQSPNQLINFLLRRKKSKLLIIEALKKFIRSKEDITIFRNIFLTLAALLKEYLDTPNQKNAEIIELQKVVSKKRAHHYYNQYLLNHGCVPADSNGGGKKENENGQDKVLELKEYVCRGKQVITQEDFYFFILGELMSDDGKAPSTKYITAVVLEYINCLFEVKLQVNPLIYEFLIQLMLANNQFYQCYQLIQYKIVSDSLHIAFLLLSFEKQYPSCLQISIDMLKRLNYPKQIIKVLLVNGKVMEALWYTKKFRYEVLINPQNYLDIALSKKDSLLEFYYCFHFFAKGQNSFVNNKAYLDFYNKHFLLERELLL